ncbi:hypothetical protein EV175_003669 [Coemansia sp. RSA 1933]|nr:hypothetical protein EV175_003669 [Coemansia sp. RSA 1933]
MQHHSIAVDWQQEKQRARASWGRLWRVFLLEHGFIGPQVYMAAVHAVVGVAVWAAGIGTGSLALMSYAFLVLFDATSLFVDLVPRALEYSANSAPSVEYAFGLRVLPTLLEFTNGLSLLYRGIQALKEGVEHLATSSHEHAMAAIEFETYAHQAPEHNSGTVLASAAALSAVVVTAVSAARFANHRALWELCSSGHAATQMQNVTLNPFNAASFLVGSWMVYVAVLLPPAKESIVEPISCVLVAVVMAVVGASACLHLGRHLLHATTRESADLVRRVVALVLRVPGVVDCSNVYDWSPAVGERAGMMRVVVDSGTRSSEPRTGDVSVHKQIQDILLSHDLGTWTLHICHTASTTS